MAFIICCSPAASDAGETLSSLHFSTLADGIVDTMEVINLQHSKRICTVQTRDVHKI